jgi:natural product precursor
MQNQKTMIMKKLGKLELNFQRILKNEELLVLRGGYDENCPCGTGVQNWWCKVWRYGIFYFDGYACGPESYIRSIYPESEGYRLELTGPFQDCL